MKIASRKRDFPRRRQRQNAASILLVNYMYVYIKSKTTI